MRFLMPCTITGTLFCGVLLMSIGAAIELKVPACMRNNTFLHTIDRRLNHLYVSNHTKVLLYFTTTLKGYYLRHYPRSNHLSQFKNIWPFALRKSDLLRNSDVLIHATVTLNDRSNAYNQKNKTALAKTPDHLCRGLSQAVRFFPNRNITIRFIENPGYQAGAIKSMVDGYRQGWFAPYDWVIRLNGDTVIYDDTRLAAFMQESNCSAVLSNCARSLQDPVKVMSDFFAFRPDRVDYSTWGLDWWSRLNAEHWTTEAFQAVIDLRNHRWIQSLSKYIACRIVQQDITHQHFCWQDQIHRLLNSSENIPSVSNEPCIDA